MDAIHSTDSERSAQASGGVPKFAEHANIIPALSELDQLLDQERLNESPGSAVEDAVEDFVTSKEHIAREGALLQHKELTQDLASWVDRYGQVGDRSEYLWTWCRQGIELTTLPCVPADAFAAVCDTKLLGVMFDVLIDDVADQGGDEPFLEQLIGIATSNTSGVQMPADRQCFNEQERDYAAFTETVWGEVQSRVERFPRYQLLADLLRYDYMQLMNTMRYAHLLNRFPSLLNLAEHDLYLPHNMHMMVSATMDLMCSPDFDLDEIGRLREAVWHAQYMGRIGNLVTTWERELHEGDFTSGVFAHAVIYGELSLDGLSNGDRNVIEKIIRDGQHEEHFLRRWQQHRRCLIGLLHSIHSVDLRPLVHGLERLICLHLASRGSK